MDTKTCSDCGKTKPLSEFYMRSTGNQRAGNPQSYCKACHVARSGMFRAKRRDAVYERLGGKCACCDEREPMFLTVDHKNNDGAAHRRELGANHTTRTKGSASITNWLYGRPEEDHRFQLLCWNCNAGRHRNGGVCPHEEARARTHPGRVS